jgi:spermidine synthase
MKPRELLGTGTAPDGGILTLHKEAAGYVVRIGNEVLMSSRLYGSERAMAVESLEAALRSARPRVLIGGLGMGYTLRETLDILPRTAEVVVAELFGCVVEWNRGVLAPLSHDALADPRVGVEVRDVQELVRKSGTGFDAILLDVDNGPDALTTLGNRTIYTHAGLSTLHSSLRPGGTLAVWSVTGSRAFEKALARAGFRVEVKKLDARHDASRGGRHTLFLAHKALAPRKARPSGPQESAGPARRRRRQGAK